MDLWVNRSADEVFELKMEDEEEEKVKKTIEVINKSFRVSNLLIDRRRSSRSLSTSEPEALDEVLGL